MNIILNNKLKWDGSHLGNYFDSFINKWESYNTKYYTIFIPEDRFKSIDLKINEKDRKLSNGGIIYCTIKCTKDVFPCIVEDIKCIFGLSRRGLHRININNKEYIIYYTNLTAEGELIWETPLSKLESKHEFRSNKDFIKEVQKIIAINDILSLSNTSESNICIRSCSNNKFNIISVNEIKNSISYLEKKGKGESYDFSIINKTLFNRWFGEKTSICDLIKEICNYNSFKYPLLSSKNKQTSNEIVVITTKIRNKIEKIIYKYDKNYIWYNSIIIDRLSRNLLSTLR